MKNLLPKIFVSVAAIVLWILIVSGQNYVNILELPLSVYEPRTDMTLAEPLPKTIKVRVEGPGRALYFQQRSKKSSMILDVGTITGNERLSLKNYFRERPNQVILAKELSFLEVVYPDSIDIHIDNKISKNVTVNILSDISVKQGYIQVGEPEGPEVTLEGPEGYLQSIEYVQTELLKRVNADMSFSQELPVINPNPELLTLSPEFVKVDINIEMIGERTIPNIPVNVKNQPADLEIQFIPNIVSLRVTGGNNQIQDLTQRDFLVYFDYLTQWFPNKNYYPVKIISPDEVLEVIRIVPEKIEVVVLRKQNP